MNRKFFFYLDLKMTLKIKELFDNLYQKIKEFKKNNYGRIQKIFHFKKDNSFDTESNPNIDLEYDNDTLEYYSDISDDEYDSRERKFIFLGHTIQKPCYT